MEATGWLIVLALSSQVVGWLLITVSLGRLPAAKTSVLLTLQPLLAVLFAALLVDERPSPLQLVGAAVDPLRPAHRVDRTAAAGSRSRPSPSIRHSFGTVGVGPRS